MHREANSLVLASARGERIIPDPAREPIVLVVDDCDDTREAYAEHLRRHGLCVEQAHNGREAAEKALASGPDVVVMALSTPESDERDVPALPPSPPRARNIAVVAFSADDADEGQSHPQRVGCLDFLDKPCSPNLLLAAVWAALDR